MSIIDESMIMRSQCGESPCIARHYIQLGREHKSRAGVDNKSKRFHAHQTCIRDKCGMLGQGQRVRLLHCVESMIKNKFPNDEYPFIGFRESSEDMQFM